MQRNKLFALWPGRGKALARNKAGIKKWWLYTTMWLKINTQQPGMFHVAGGMRAATPAVGRGRGFNWAWA